MHSRLGLLLLVALWGLGLRGGFAAQGEVYEVKAAFLYNFALFTDWPAGPKSCTICVLGQSPFGDRLDRYVGREAQGRRVDVRSVDSVREARSCQVLFIASTEHHRMAEIHRELEQSPVLTVTEANGFDPRDVMIVLTPAQNRLAFEVNQTAAEATGLKFSSKLLRLARRIY